MIYVNRQPWHHPQQNHQTCFWIPLQIHYPNVYGSDICTYRPYLTHFIEDCIKTAQRGGWAGVVISYYRKERKKFVQSRQIFDEQYMQEARGGICPITLPVPRR